MDLRSKALSGTFWNVLMIVTVSGMDLVIFTVLARNLPISEFALLTFCFLIVEFGNIFVTAGINQNLIQRKIWEDSYFNSVASIVFILGLLLSILILVIGTPIAYFHYSLLSSQLIASLCILPLIMGLQSIYSAKLEREFRNRELTSIKASASLVSGIAILTMIHNGFGIWAAIFGKVFQNIYVLIFLFFKAKAGFRFTFDSDHLFEIKSFCAPLLGIAFINFFQSKGSNLLVGGILGADKFAFLSVANKAYDTLSRLTISTVNTMIVPTLSRVETDRKVESFYQVILMSASTITPCFLGLAALSDPMIDVTFGDKYQDAAFLIKVLSFAIIPSLIAWFLPSLLISIGKTQVALQLKFFSIARTLGVALVTVWFGLEVMVISQAIVTFIVVPFQIQLSKKEVAISLTRILSIVAPYVAASIVMFCLLEVFLLYSSLSSFLEILSGIAIGVFVYIILVLTLFKSSASRVYSTFKNAWSSGS